MIHYSFSPFHISNRESFFECSGTLKRIITGNWIKEFHMDPSVQDLLNRMFKVDPQERATLEDVQKYLHQRKVRKEGSLEELEAALLVEAKRLGF